MIIFIAKQYVARADSKNEKLMYVPKHVCTQ